MLKYSYPFEGIKKDKTYIDGKVECLESGVYKSDIEFNFVLNSDSFQGLIGNVDRDLVFATNDEEGKRITTTIRKKSRTWEKPFTKVGMKIYSKSLGSIHR